MCNTLCIRLKIILTSLFANFQSHIVRRMEMRMSIYEKEMNEDCFGKNETILLAGEESSRNSLKEGVTSLYSDSPSSAVACLNWKISQVQLIIIHTGSIRLSRFTRTSCLPSKYSNPPLTSSTFIYFTIVLIWLFCYLLFNRNKENDTCRTRMRTEATETFQNLEN